MSLPVAALFGFVCATLGMLSGIYIAPLFRNEWWTKLRSPAPPEPLDLPPFNPDIEETYRQLRHYQSKWRRERSKRLSETKLGVPEQFTYCPACAGDIRVEMVKSPGVKGATQFSSAGYFPVPRTMHRKADVCVKCGRQYLYPYMADGGGEQHEEAERREGR